MTRRLGTSLMRAACAALIACASALPAAEAPARKPLAIADYTRWIGMGAGVTDLYFDFSQNWGWSYQVTGSSGANGSDYSLYSQGREETS